MVKSILNPSIEYIEKRIIDPEDKGHSSSMYILEVFDLEIVVVLGKPKYTYSNKDIVYYPIYVVSKENKIKSQIGVFESVLANTIRLVDEEGDIDIDKLGEPLLYSFVNKKYIQLANSDPKKYIESPIQMQQPLLATKKDDTNTKDYIKASYNKEKDDDSCSSSDEECDIFSLKKTKKPKSEDETSGEKDKKGIFKKEGVFVIDSKFRKEESLIEETEEDADDIVKKYRESASNLWIEKFMKNNNYGIVDNEGGGDCLFAVIRDAYAHIGYQTTVYKLRELLSSQLTLDKYESDRKLYLEFESRKEEIKSSMKDLKTSMEEYEKRLRKIKKQESPNNEEIEKINDNMKDLFSKYEMEKKELKKTEKDQTDYIGYISEIDSLEKYRDYMKSSNYWGDAWAISTLEALLKVKLIIFSEEAYSQRFNDGVLNCGIVSQILENKPFDPEYYIMTTYSGSHYRLITYKNKHIFNYKEIPYSVKILIVNKCLEKNAGIYYKIQDFRNFKSMLGLSPDEGEPKDDDDVDDSNDYLYNKDTVFTFHSKSLASAKPGMGTGEQIPADRRSEFTNLSKINNWRRMLDDSWVGSPFRVDNHMWASVEHYVQASRFKKGFPDFYLQFSLDNPSELSQDPEVAKAAADLKKGKTKALRPAGIKEDVDYSLGRNIEERETALRAKFTQNDELKRVLYNTRDALLTQYLRRQPAKKDILMMKIRQEIRS